MHVRVCLPIVLWLQSFFTCTLGTMIAYGRYRKLFFQEQTRFQNKHYWFITDSSQSFTGVEVTLCLCWQHLINLKGVEYLAILELNSSHIFAKCITCWRRLKCEDFADHLGLAQWPAQLWTTIGLHLYAGEFIPEWTTIFATFFAQFKGIEVQPGMKTKKMRFC